MNEYRPLRHLLQVLQQYLPFTVLKLDSAAGTCKQARKLQQYLPFTVLKLLAPTTTESSPLTLQQYLPFTVLKLFLSQQQDCQLHIVATVLTVYGIETLKHKKLSLNRMLQQYLPFTVLKLQSTLYHIGETVWCCNSTYRLRY